MFKGLKILLLLIVLLISRVGISSYTAFNGDKANTTVSAGPGFTDVRHLDEMPVESLESEDFSEKIGRQLNAVLPCFSEFFDIFREESFEISLPDYTVARVIQDKHILNRVFRI